MCKIADEYAALLREAAPPAVQPDIPLKALTDAGMVDDDDRLRWEFVPGRLEVASAGGTLAERVTRLLVQTRYLIEDMRRRQSAPPAVQEPPDLREIDTRINLLPRVKVDGLDYVNLTAVLLLVRGYSPAPAREAETPQEGAK